MAQNIAPTAVHSRLCVFAGERCPGANQAELFGAAALSKSVAKLLKEICGESTAG